MFRSIVVTAILIGFLFAQATPSVCHTPFERAEKPCSTLKVADNQSPDDSDSPVSTEDEEESDAPQYTDGLKFVISHMKFQFIPSFIETLWADSHFSPWSLTSDFDRPPKIIA